MARPLQVKHSAERVCMTNNACTVAVRSEHSHSTASTPAPTSPNRQTATSVSHSRTASPPFAVCTTHTRSACTTSLYRLRTSRSPLLSAVAAPPPPPAAHRHHRRHHHRLRRHHHRLRLLRRLRHPCHLPARHLRPYSSTSCFGRGEASRGGANGEAHRGDGRSVPVRPSSPACAYTTGRMYIQYLRKNDCC